MSNDWIKADRIAGSAASRGCYGEPTCNGFAKIHGLYRFMGNIYNISVEKSPRQYQKEVLTVPLMPLLGLVLKVTLPMWVNPFLDQTTSKTVAKGSAMGSMVGNTGLAIYYPTDQLVPIINFTAQGSGYGSLSAENLALVKLRYN